MVYLAIILKPFILYSQCYKLDKDVKIKMSLNDDAWLNEKYLYNMRKKKMKRQINIHVMYKKFQHTILCIIINLKKMFGSNIGGDFKLWHN